MLGAELLDALRDKAQLRDVRYAEPPVHLGGGFFTENHAFRLAGASPPWDVPLVLRLFPSVAPPDLPHREAAVQRVLADQGYPAPRVLLFDEHARLAGWRYFVMERLPGHPMMGGLRVGELARSGWRLFARLAEVTARAQASLHRLDAGPLLIELESTPAGVERWLTSPEAALNMGAAGLSKGMQWLVDHQPPQPVRPTICHGDLWAGNILVSAGTISGVLDWSMATVAEPALDVGFTAMSLDLAPIDAPRPIQRIAARFGRSICRRYVHAYQRETGADLSNQRYYEALRCAIELSAVASYRSAAATGEPHDVPRPTWDWITDEMLDYFKVRTDVALDLPPPVPSS